MAKHRSDGAPAIEATLANLAAVVSQLIEEIRVLVSAIDDLTCEQQWRNNEERCRSDGDLHHAQPIRSMSADPAAEDFRFNRSEPTAAAREDSDSSVQSTGPTGSSQQDLF